MKKFFCLIFLAVFSLLSLLSLTACDGCSSKYKDYDDFQKNGSYKEKEDFYDWWSRNP